MYMYSTLLLLHNNNRKLHTTLNEKVKDNLPQQTSIVDSKYLINITNVVY